MPLLFRALAALTLTLTFAGGVREDVIDRVAADFRHWVDDLGSMVGKKGTDYSAEIQEKTFQNYLNQSHSLAAREEITYQEYFAIRKHLNSRFGYRLGPPPLTAGDFDYRKIIVAVRPRQWQPRSPADRLFTVNQAAPRVSGGHIHITPQDIARTKEEEAEIWQRMVETASKTDLKLRARLPHYYFFSKEDGRMTRIPAPSKTEIITVSLNQRGDNNLDLAMELVAATPSGREWLAKLEAAQAKGEVEVRPLTGAIRARSFGCLGGACRPEPDGKRTIYIDPLDPPGRLAATLVHEIVHAVTPFHTTNLLKTNRERAALEEQIKAAARSYRRVRGEIDSTQEKAMAPPGLEDLPVALRFGWELKRARLERRGEQETLEAETEAHAAHKKFVEELTDERAFPDAKPFYDLLDKQGLLPLDATEDSIATRYQLWMLRPDLKPKPAGGHISPKPCIGNWGEINLSRGTDFEIRRH